ncbi:heme ABC transporter ATP-binding protein/permease CydC [Vibrio algarum]|uniref:Cysteine/glutathione ABC transporter ATP-binding protein/permease CydC n=1 Tax=Vibrio algarum TaxID=3020714 RepID=A0ABT4YQX2_9VIBR|nr:cysteine/glutathione ABC transporter ATP-binding protein/permease CydC [Vibrio sp. KJ40-1]MDB1123950.1 cysteine/glutathione ABC transporter ATP-binding protein/permease CydC [Vibrio sp. KJ40-1]
MRELLPYLQLYKKHWFGLSAGMLLAFTTLFASVGLLTLSGWFISASAVAGLTVARETFNYMLPGGGVRGLAMGRTAGRWGERVVSHNATFKLLTELRVFFFKKLAPLVPGRVANLRDGDLLNRLVADVDAMDHVYLRLLSPVVVSAFGIATLTLFLAWFDFSLGLILGSILLSLLIIWPVVFYKLGKHNGQQLTTHKSDLRVTSLDWLQGHSELVLFGAEERYRNAILDTQKKLLANQYVNANLTGMANGLLMLANGLTLTLILWLAADGVGGNPPDPMVALFAFATMASFEMLMPIAGAFQYLGQTLTSARRLNEIILAEPEVCFPEHGSLKSENYNIHFDSVSFSYDDTNSAVIKDFNLHVEAGSRVAILGQTGSGKSTLIQLLCRYWDTNKGSISIASTALTQISEENLRNTISVVSQRVDILNGTLKDNLAMAKPDATDDELKSVLVKVGLQTLLEDKGIDTWLGDGGRQLSGGEKRRVGIARAILHNAPIILLDEPTEGLDKKTERQIMDLFSQHFVGKTVIFITHRLVGLDSMDQICLIEDGSIAEQGSHDELLDLKGRYHRLHQTL